MRNEILTTVYGYFHYKQKSIASLELMERIILEKDYRQITSIILELLKEINHAENYFDEIFLHEEDRGFAKTFIEYLEIIMTSIFDEVTES
jgi:hypothetical protein